MADTVLLITEDRSIAQKVRDACRELEVSLTHRGASPAGVPHTPWRLVEHMRIAQRDILEFCRNPEHVSPKFPDGYWPDGTTPPAPAAWDSSVDSFRADLRAMQNLVADSSSSV